MRRPRRTATLAVAGSAIVGVATLSVLSIGHAEQPEKAVGPQPRAETKPAIDPKADALLRRMSEFMDKQQRFAVHSEGELEVVLEDGQKLEFPFEADVLVQRPNKLRVERHGAKTDLRFYYDGKEIVLYGAIQNVYAKAPAPPTLEGAIDHARDILGIEAPGADLLYMNSYGGLIPDVVSAIHLGTEMVRGMQCEHLAFRGKEVDFQIWIRSGATPTPCRYVVTTPGIEGKPAYSANFVNWNLSPRFDDTAFVFKPQASAEQISFLTAEDLKAHALDKAKKQGDAP